MKKRGQKGKFCREIQRKICRSLRLCNSYKTAAQSVGITEQTLFSWLRDETKPLFALAVHRARAAAKAKLVKIITDAAPRDFRAACWLLERSYSAEYSRTEMRIIEQKAEEPKKFGCRIFYDVGNGTLAELLNFPKHSSLVQHERELEQAKVNAAETTDDAVTEAPESEISEEGPPPQSAPKFLTGRIPESWKKKTANGHP